MASTLDFNDLRQRAERLFLRDALPYLPDIPLMSEAAAIYSDGVLRLFLLAQMCLEANDAIIEAGWDPTDFHIDGPSAKRFMTTDHLDDDDAMFNGVCFDWQTEQGTVVRVAMSVVLDEEGQPCPSIVDILRIGPEDDHWQILDEGAWDDDGPPAELFQFLEEAWEEDDGDEWAEDATIAQLSISVTTYNALDQAGIETMDELTGLKPKTLRALPGMTEAGAIEVEQALAEEGLALRE